VTGGRHVEFAAGQTRRSIVVLVVWCLDRHLAMIGNGARRGNRRQGPSPGAVVGLAGARLMPPDAGAITGERRC
jgi:hypothetical protein